MRRLSPAHFAFVILLSSTAFWFQLKAIFQ
jgi:hypothetical protein